MSKFHIVKREAPAIFLWKAPPVSLVSPYMWGTEQEMNAFLISHKKFQDIYGEDLCKLCTRDFTGDETAHFLSANADAAVTVLEIEAPPPEKVKEAHQSTAYFKVAVVAFILGAAAWANMRGYF